MDNFFTNLETSIELLEKNIHVIGTVRTNKSWIPDTCFLKGQQKGFMNFRLNTFFRENTEIKVDKNVFLLHYFEKEKKGFFMLNTIPEMNQFVLEDKIFACQQLYNKEMCSIDVIDGLIREMSTRRSSRKWTVIVFSIF